MGDGKQHRFALAQVSNGRTEGSIGHSVYRCAICHGSAMASRWYAHQGLRKRREMGQPAYGYGCFAEICSAAIRGGCCCECT
jgi:hypothetical protein